MKKVYRSRHTKVLGGVAAGLADYFAIDVTVMRLLFALLLVTLPNTIIAYILAWIIIPEEPLGMNVSPGGAMTGGATMSHPYVPEPSTSTVPVSTAPPEPKQERGSNDRSRQLLGYILIAIGAAVIFRKYVPSFIWSLPIQLIGRAWPALIILAGVAIIFGALRGR